MPLNTSLALGRYWDRMNRRHASGLLRSSSLGLMAGVRVVMVDQHLNSWLAAAYKTLQYRARACNT